MDYMPTDGKSLDAHVIGKFNWRTFILFPADILRARLKTLGVSEHRFTLKAGKHCTEEKYIDIYGLI